MCPTHFQKESTDVHQALDEAAKETRALDSAAYMTRKEQLAKEVGSRMIVLVGSK